MDAVNTTQQAVPTSRAARRAGKQKEYLERQAELKRRKEQREARQVALKEKAAQPGPTAEVKKAMPQVPQKSAPSVAAAKSTVKHEIVKLRDGTEFVIIFSVPRRKVPKELQVLRQCGGQPAAVANGAPAQQDIRFSKVDVELGSLMARAYVDFINICQGERDFCRVYVNCIVGVGGKLQGFNTWAGPYEVFVRKNVWPVWGRAILKTNNGKTSFELRKPIDGMPETIIRFAIDRS